MAGASSSNGTGSGVKARHMRWLFNLWPPFLCAGIRVLHIADDWRHVRVSLTRRWYNRNYIGTHYGGSLFSMADPFYMLMLLHNLPPDLRVLDKAGCVDFLALDKKRVTADFRLEQSDIDDIVQAAASGEKVLRDFSVDIVNAEGKPVARVIKTLYIRKKRSVQ